MPDLSAVVLAVITAAFTGAIAFFYNRLNRKLDAQRDERQKAGREMQAQSAAIKEGVQLVLHFVIQRQCEYHIREGWCSVDNKDAMEKMHQEYHALGGNGTLSDLMQTLRALPISAPNRRQP